jgi:UDP-N-acetylmuramoylalanine--D-glutamate ligase
MLKNHNIFNKKNILVYGVGKSGLSTFKFLKKENKVYLFDDVKKINNNKETKKNIISYKKLLNKDFDCIIIRPGIDINECKLRSYLKKKSKKIYTDLDIFFNFYSINKNITITGTNGKSTTARILYEVLRDQKFDVRLVGNIGNPILLEKNIKNSTIFIVEASSYQLEYSQLFRSNISAILNISPDHLERHKTLKNYIKAKFKLVKNQTKKDYTILNINNTYIKREVELQNFLPKIIKVDKCIDFNIIKKIHNPYFYTDGIKENLTFVFEIIKLFKIKRNILFLTLKRFKGLSYRQQIIYKTKKLTIINDSKATSFSSSESLLKSLPNANWIVGGLFKKNDKFSISKKYCKNFKAYIFGKNKKFYINELKDKMQIESFINLKSLLKKIILDVKINKLRNHKTILFSPAGASFDSFKNFEERGKYFNNFIKKNINVL